jgi:DNA-directed RNA polymerase subunit RPC12/RpoP
MDLLKHFPEQTQKEKDLVGYCEIIRKGMKHNEKGWSAFIKAKITATNPDVMPLKCEKCGFEGLYWHKGFNRWFCDKCNKSAIKTVTWNNERDWISFLDWASKFRCHTCWKEIKNPDQHTPVCFDCLHKELVDLKKVIPFMRNQLDWYSRFDVSTVNNILEFRRENKSYVRKFYLAKKFWHTFQALFPDESKKIVANERFEIIYMDRYDKYFYLTSTAHAFFIKSGLDKNPKFSSLVSMADDLTALTDVKFWATKDYINSQVKRQFSWGEKKAKKLIPYNIYFHNEKMERDRKAKELEDNKTKDVIVNVPEIQKLVQNEVK